MWIRQCAQRGPGVQWKRGRLQKHRLCRPRRTQRQRRLRERRAQILAAQVSRRWGPEATRAAATVRWAPQPSHRYMRGRRRLHPSVARAVPRPPGRDSPSARDGWCRHGPRPRSPADPPGSRARGPVWLRSRRQVAGVGWEVRQTRVRVRESETGVGDARGGLGPMPVVRASPIDQDSGSRRLPRASSRGHGAALSGSRSCCCWRFG